jgi:hypothetical protein
MSLLARELLAEKGFDVVARKIAQYLAAEPDRPSVVTGFRTLEELEFFKHQYPDAQVVLLESTERTRFERYLERARPDSVTNLRDFADRDKDQWDFGLLAVAEDFADLRITNEGTLEDFFRQVDALLGGQDQGHVVGVSVEPHSARKSERSQLLRCLRALAALGRSVDCNEISDATITFGPVIRFNNVNKILKRYPQLARRIEVPGEKVLYQVTECGRTYLRMSDARRSS